MVVVGVTMVSGELGKFGEFGEGLGVRLRGQE